MGPPHVQSDGPLTLYGTGITWSPHMYNMFFQDTFERGPLLS